MERDQTSVTTATQSLSGMSRDEIVAFFQRRQELYDDLDAAALAADYAEDAVINSPIAGTHTGRAAAERVMRALSTLSWTER